MPRGFFWFGSEQTSKLFKGWIQDAVFVAKELRSNSIRKIVNDLQNNQDRFTSELIEEELVAIEKNKTPE